jgi:hypothetical protein
VNSGRDANVKQRYWLMQGVLGMHRSIEKIPW